MHLQYFTQFATRKTSYLRIIEDERQHEHTKKLTDEEGFSFFEEPSVPWESLESVEGRSTSNLLVHFKPALFETWEQSNFFIKEVYSSM